jgi:undecaprenyl diphosphate synthase
MPQKLRPIPEVFPAPPEDIDPRKLDMSRIPRHVAIIMDGNGRWAKTRGLERVAGHEAGIASVREAIQICNDLGIRFLTIYAFSTENWNRPQEEVDALMEMFAETMAAELPGLEAECARVNLIGNMGELPTRTRDTFEHSIEETIENDGLTLTMAVNYGGRSELVDAMRLLAHEVADGARSWDSIDEAAVSTALYAPDMPDPDLLIRTSGEQRISNFMIWETAYSEFYVTEKFWPDFDRYEFLRALIDYQGRDRRFGRV